LKRTLNEGGNQGGDKNDLVGGEEGAWGNRGKACKVWKKETLGAGFEPQGIPRHWGVQNKVGERSREEGGGVFIGSKGEGGFLF